METKTEVNAKIETLLPEIEELCRKDHVALIDRESLSVIKEKLKEIKCRRLLEIGSGYGYSALSFFTALEEQGKITTIERLQSRWETANYFFSCAGVSAQICCILGEAPDAFSCIDFTEKWDCIFMDAAMGRYTDFWLQLKDFLRPGGIFIADNINLHHVLDVEPMALPRRHRTMQKRLKSFLQVVATDPDWQWQQYDYGDGLLIAQKIKADNENR